MVSVDRWMPPWLNHLIKNCGGRSVVACVDVPTETKYKVKTLVVAADFSSEDIYDGIKDKIGDLDIGVLVNNVGVSYDYPEYYAEVDKPDVSVVMSANVCK